MMRERRCGGDVRNRYPLPISHARIRNYGYSPPRLGNEERGLRYLSGSSSYPREPERSSRISSSTGGGGGPVERRDYNRHFDGDRDGQFQVERRDYNRHFDGEIDGQLQRLSGFDERLSPEDSTSKKFQWKHLLEEPTKLNAYLNPVSKHTSDYGLSAYTSYQDTGESDIDRSRMLVEKPVSAEIVRPRMYSPHHLGIGLSKSSGHGDGMFLSPLRNRNVGLDYNEDLQFRDHLRRDKLPASDKLSAREVFKEEENPVFYMRDTFHAVIPSPKSKGFATMTSGISKDDSPGYYNVRSYPRSERFSRSSGMLTEPAAHIGYGHQSHTKSPMEAEDPLSDVINHRHTQISPYAGKRRDYAYPDVWREEKGDTTALAGKFCGKMVSLLEDHARHDSFRTSIVDPIDDTITVTESSYKAYLSENKQWEHYSDSQGRPTPSCPDARGTSHLKELDGEVLGYRSAHLDYERKVYRDQESLPLVEDYRFENGAGRQFLEGRLDKVPMTGYDPSLDRIDESLQKRLVVEELGLHEPPRKILKGKHGMDRKTSRNVPLNSRWSNGKTARKVHDLGDAYDQWAGENIDSLYLSKKPRSSHTQYRKAGWTPDMVASRTISTSRNRLSSDSIFSRNHLNKPQKFGSRDIKKRLRPGPPNVYSSNHYVKRYKRYRKPGTTHNGFHGNPQVQEGDSTEAMVTAAKVEPPESSEDFKQLLHSAFFKFVKQLNENTAQRRRFMEQGHGSLKCSICGSNSEEFVDTESLVMHAYTSSKVGLRTQHLGFHKALCVLMGWKGEVASNSSWVRQVLPDDEALAMKEDHIIWPPVVVIHNSSINNDNPDERVIVSIEDLEAILREMGFKGKTKVCRGKPANQSTMVVKFNSTFSGLQEAERLHNFYIEKKHCRAEFQQINSHSSGSKNVGKQKESTKKVENVLYGYLGIAEDLEKLDFETKKRCLVKSKKEIHEIAEAPLKSKN